MNVEDQIAKLESLLGRIKRKAAEPRPASVQAAVATPPEAAPMANRAPVSAASVTVRAESPPAPMAAPVSRATPAAGTPSARVEQAAPAELEELDMMDEEIVEIDVSVTGSSEPPGTEIDLDGMDEPVPESAPRAAQALADQADLEPPVKTPPPESGRQVMAPGAGPSVTYQEQDDAEEVDLTGAGDVDALLEADHSGGPISKAPPGRPTMEQLGETVELEGADAPAPELELLMPAPEHEAEPDELELSLPRQEFAGGYDSSLPPPSQTTADLHRHRQDEPHAPPSLAEPMAMSAMPPTEVAPAPRFATPAAAAPLIVERPPVTTLHAAEVITAKPAKLPETFLDLLDGSLRL